MNKILLIIRREYITRVRKKIFIITTFLTPLGFALIFLLPILINKASTESKVIAVTDESGVFKDKLENKGDLTFRYLNVQFDSLKKTYKGLHFSGILHIPADYNMYNNSVPVEYFSDEQIGFGIQSAISSQLTDIVTRERLVKVNSDLSPEMIQQLSEGVKLSVTVQGASGEKRANTGVATAIGSIMGFFLYFIIMIYGVMVMRGVMEEKANRIAEIMVSSVKPFQLMMGKIIGIALVGLTQFAAWIILIVIILGGLQLTYSTKLEQAQKQVVTMQQMSPAGQQQVQQQFEQQMGGWDSFGKAVGELNDLPIGLLIFGFIFYFFGGYMIYASLFAAVGSAAGEEQEQAQALSLIATLPIIISFVILVNTIQQPNSTLSVIASIFPLTSPIVMCGRLPFEPPMWQIVSSMLILVAGFIFTVWLAGKIYRVGILMYGKKVTLRELGKWIMYKN